MIADAACAAATSASGLLASIPSPPINGVHIGPISLRFYGLMIALGVLAGVWVTTKRWARWGGRGEFISDVAVWAIPAGLVGARIYHLITDWQLYRGRELHALYIWEGGLGIWGGIALGTAVGAWRVHKAGVNPLYVMDAAAVALPIGQAIARLGNWFNQELFGRPTSLPWGLEIDEVHRPAGYEQYATFHPAFLYEGLWNLSLAGVLVLVERRFRLKRGQSFALYVAGYTLGRWWIENLRIDPVNHIGGFRINALVAPTVCLLAVGAFFWLARSPRLQPTAADPLPRAEAGWSDRDGADADGGDTAGVHVTAQDGADSQPADPDEADTDEADTDEAGADEAVTDGSGGDGAGRHFKQPPKDRPPA